jgi:hypothetical protein
MKKRQEVNKAVNQSEIDYLQVKRLVAATPGNFRCRKCNSLRLEWYYFEEDADAKLKEVLITPCQTCKTVGFLKFN